MPSEDHTLWHQLRDLGLGCLSAMFMRLISHNHGTLVTPVFPPAPRHDSYSRMRRLIKGSFQDSRELKHEPGLYLLLLTLFHRNETLVGNKFFT